MGEFKFKKPKPKVGMGIPSPVNLKLLDQLAYDRGFNQGVKAQREKDIDSTVTMLEGLENIQGIGEKTAWKIREHVMKQFGAQS